ncbi:MAG: bifunctional DNA primase/polymerase [Dehalococcoidia bacterium]|nr:bifunctional DNA primase/polymerase [Dehalococcoidia bacterium]
MSAPTIAAAWAEFYRHAEIDTVPLPAGAKRCALKQWPIRDSRELWDHADRHANIAVRSGGHGLLVFDCDDFSTAEYVVRWLEGLGLMDVPGAVTRRGQHVYVRTSIPAGFTSAKFSPADFEGELRGNRSYSVAPPSVVGDWQYRPVGDVHAIPVIEWRDVRWLVPEEKPDLSTSAAPPIPILRRNLPARAKRLAAQLEQAPKGVPVDKYPSRSEALWAYWALGISAGQSYRELRRQLGDIDYTDRWLQQDHRRAIAAMQTVGVRPQLEQLYALVPMLVRRKDPRSQRTDTIVLKGCIGLAWAGSGMDWVIHSPDVAKATGLSRRTVDDSLKRLERCGMLTLAAGRFKGYRLGHPLCSMHVKSGSRHA